MVNLLAILLKFTVGMSIGMYMICLGPIYRSHSSMTSTDQEKRGSHQLSPDGGWGYVCIGAVFVLQVSADYVGAPTSLWNLEENFILKSSKVQHLHLHYRFTAIIDWVKQEWFKRNFKGVCLYIIYIFLYFLYSVINNLWEGQTFKMGWKGGCNFKMFCWPWKSLKTLASSHPKLVGTL